MFLYPSHPTTSLSQHVIFKNHQNSIFHAIYIGEAKIKHNARNY